jgi:hypothetical protein
LSSARSILYRDMRVAPGSTMYQAIVDSTSAPSPEGRALAAAKVKKLYDEGNAQFKKSNPNWAAFP